MVQQQEKVFFRSINCLTLSSNNRSQQSTSPSNPSHQSAANPPIPPIYRYYHILIEPLMAVSGVCQLFFVPETYFSYMPASSSYHLDSRIICNQLASAYLFMAIVEALVLRVAKNDWKIWRAVVLALVVCDIGHVYASWVEMGNEEFFRPWMWGIKDGMGLILTIGPLLLRGAFLMGIKL